MGVKKWCSANVFSDTRQKYVCRKIFKSERLLAVLRDRIIFSVKWVEVRKTSKVFWAKLYCKMSDIFCYFLLALRISARKSDIKKNLWCPLEHPNEYKKVAYVKKYFQKKTSKHEILNHLYFGPNFVILGTALRWFSQCFFWGVFAMGQLWWSTFLLRPPSLPLLYHKKASYDLEWKSL